MKSPAEHAADLIRDLEADASLFNVRKGSWGAEVRLTQRAVAMVEQAIKAAVDEARREYAGKTAMAIALVEQAIQQEAQSTIDVPALPCGGNS